MKLMLTEVQVDYLQTISEMSASQARAIAELEKRIKVIQTGISQRWTRAIKLIGQEARLEIPPEAETIVEGDRIVGFEWASQSPAGLDPLCDGHTEATSAGKSAQGGIVNPHPPTTP